MCVGFALLKGPNYFSVCVGQRLHFDVFLPTSSRVFKVSNFQLRHSPFFTWFVVGISILICPNMLCAI